MAYSYSLNGADYVDIRSIPDTPTLCYIHYITGHDPLRLLVDSGVSTLSTNTWYKSTGPVKVSGYGTILVLNQLEHDATLSEDIPHSATGLPKPYAYAVSADGKLQLTKHGAVIMEQDEYGAWIRTSVSTGVGSLHLGEAHSIGSAGSNIATINHHDDMVYYHPWQGFSLDGTDVLALEARYPNPLQRFELGGVVMPHFPAIDTIWEIHNPPDCAVFSYSFALKEGFTGRLCFECHYVDGPEVAQFYLDVVWPSNTTCVLPIKYPLWFSNTMKYALKVTDASTGLPLKALQGATGGVWRSVSARTFRLKEINSGGYRGVITASTHHEDLFPMVKGDWWVVTPTTDIDLHLMYLDAGCIVECYTSCADFDPQWQLDSFIALTAARTGGSGGSGGTGAQGPKGDKGDTGDVGPQGAAGTNGAVGTPGSVWHHVTSYPDDTMGADGDWALNTITLTVFQKVAGVFYVRGNIRGADGNAGAKGDKGDTGDVGPQGIQGPKGDTGASGSGGGGSPFGPNGFRTVYNTAGTSGVHTLQEGTTSVLIELQGHGGSLPAIALWGVQGTWSAQGGTGSGGYVRYWLTAAQFMSIGGQYSLGALNTPTTTNTAMGTPITMHSGNYMMTAGAGSSGANVQSTTSAINPAKGGAGGVAQAGSLMQSLLTSVNAAPLLVPGSHGTCGGLIAANTYTIGYGAAARDCAQLGGMFQNIGLWNITSGIVASDGLATRPGCGIDGAFYGSATPPPGVNVVGKKGSCGFIRITEF
jgi:hypothetical protein